MDQQLVPEFSGSTPIKVQNNQEKTEEILLGTNMGHKFKGNLREFSDIAIATLKPELEKRGIPITADAEKFLKISVIKMHFESRFSGFWCDAEISAETGEGYTAIVDGHDSNAWILFPCIHGAVNHAVIAILNDDAVLEYLKQ